MIEKTFTSSYVSKLTGKKLGTVLKYARTRNLPHTGENKAIRYIWTQKLINEYIAYLNNLKPGRQYSKTLKETTNLDTLYHRLNRSKKNGNIEQYNQTRKLLDNLKNKKTN